MVHVFPRCGCAVRTLGPSVLAGIILASAPANAQVSIVDLVGSLPPSEFMTPTAVNSDGTVVAGDLRASSTIFRWTADAGAVGLGAPPIQPTPVFNLAHASSLSVDGQRIVGFTSNSFSLGVSSGRFYRWTAGQGYTVLNAALDTFAPNACSDDATVLVGNRTVRTTDATQQYPTAFRWTQEGGFQDLGYLPLGPGELPSASAYAVSADGSVVTGSSKRVFRWTSATGMQDLGLPAGTSEPAEGTCISADGSVIAGHAQVISGLSIGSRGFRWTASGGFQTFPDLPDYPYMTIKSISGDGSTIVGYAADTFSPAAQLTPILWTSQLGVVKLEPYLASLGLDLSGWTLQTAQAISKDGSTIIGSAYHNGQYTGFLVRLGAPCVTDFNNDGASDQGDIDYLINIIAGGANPNAIDPDFNNDGVADQGDIDALINTIAGGPCP